MFKLVLEKAEEPETKLPTSAGSSKKQESSRKTSISALLTMPKAFDCVDHNKLWKILKEMGILDHLTCLLRNLYAGPFLGNPMDRGPWWATVHGVSRVRYNGVNKHTHTLLNECLSKLI